MSGAILRKLVKDIACEEWEWVAGKFVNLYNLDVAEVAEFGSGISAGTLGSVAVAEEGSDINIMTNEMSKVPGKSIYIYHHLVTSVKDNEMITQKFLRLATNHQYYPFVF